MITGKERAFPRPASEYTASGTLPDGNDAIKQQEGMALLQVYAKTAMQSLILIYGHDYDNVDLEKRAFEVANRMINQENVNEIRQK
jgi:hypothetical protein